MVGASLTVAEGLVAIATILSIVIFWLIERVQDFQRYALAFLPSERRGGGANAWKWSRTGSACGSPVSSSSWTARRRHRYRLHRPRTAGRPAPRVHTALCEVIPIVGPLLGAIPALLVALSGAHRARDRRRDPVRGDPARRRQPPRAERHAQHHRPLAIPRDRQPPHRRAAPGSSACWWRSRWRGAWEVVLDGCRHARYQSRSIRRRDREPAEPEPGEPEPAT